MSIAFSYGNYWQVDELAWYGVGRLMCLTTLYEVFIVSNSECRVARILVSCFSFRLSLGLKTKLDFLI